MQSPACCPGGLHKVTHLRPVPRGTGNVTCGDPAQLFWMLKEEETTLSTYCRSHL